MYDGMINVYKEKGYTSHDVVAKLRGILHQKRIGHTGTLDPDATGVLPVCLGKGTKLCDMITDRDKTYVAVMQLGLSTDTQDISGQVIQKRPVDVSKAQVLDVISGFVGDYMQVPPMYSALKVEGKKLYELARNGVTVERKPRPVYIHSIAVRRVELPYVEMEVSCSKGTYIRTLCHDIGQKLGCGGCMAELERVAVGQFCVEDALRLSKIEELVGLGEEAVFEHILGLEEMLSDLSAVYTRDAYADKLLRNGNHLPKELLTEPIDHLGGCNGGEQVRVYTRDGEFIAVYNYDQATSTYKNYKMFV